MHDPGIFDRASERPPMTEEQRRRRPPVEHPLFLMHPITGRKVLYANPGYTVRINELLPHESDERALGDGVGPEARSRVEGGLARVEEEAAARPLREEDVAGRARHVQSARRCRNADR